MKLYTDLAPYYFSIEEHHRNIFTDIILIRSFLDGIEKPELIDIGCGTGEHLHELSKYGIKCTGIDASKSMLEVAKERYHESADFFREDMRTFDMYNQFDMAICLFGSFNYCIEDRDVDNTLWNTWRALKSGGCGLFEVWNSIPVEKIQEKKPDHVSTSQYEDTIIERNRGFTLVPSQSRTIVEVNYTYSVTDNLETRKITDRHVMRAFTKEEIEKFIINNGFKIKNIYANMTKEPYNVQSNRMLIHFVKG